MEAKAGREHHDILVDERSKSLFTRLSDECLARQLPKDSPAGKVANQVAVSEGRLDHKHMNQQQPSINQKQRDALVQMLQEAKTKKEKQLEPVWECRDRVQAKLVPEFIEQQGAAELATTVKQLHKDHASAEQAIGNAKQALRNIESELEAKGFECNSDGVIQIVQSEIPESALQKLRQEENKALAERAKPIRPYDLAIAKVWTAESAEQAQAIVEPLI